MKGLRAIRELLPLLRLYPWALPAIVVLGILASLAEGVGISLFIPLLQGIGEEPSGGSSRVVAWLSGLFAGLPPERRIVVIAA
ncbi:MAG: hypothetical protein R3362_04010, partial [Rhodothermales bacterium]|nr:hypothetical protein [Rhodothermales bacterium]